MTALGPIVQLPPHRAAVLIAEILHRCTVGSKAVDDNFFNFALPLQCRPQQGQGRRFIALPGNEALEDTSAMVDSPPQIDHLGRGIVVAAPTLTTDGKAQASAGL